MSATLPNGPRHAPDCMGCGARNPDGLGIDVTFHEDRIEASVVFDDRHGGAPGYAHGGAVAAALDDVLGQVLVILGQAAVTASLTVEFRRPVLLGRHLTMSARADAIDGRKLCLSGSMRDGDTLLAEARGLFLAVDSTHWSDGGRKLPAGWEPWGAP